MARAKRKPFQTVLSVLPFPICIEQKYPLNKKAALRYNRVERGLIFIFL